MSANDFTLQEAAILLDTYLQIHDRKIDWIAAPIMVAKAMERIAANGVQISRSYNYLPEVKEQLRKIRRVYLNEEASQADSEAFHQICDIYLSDFPKYQQLLQCSADLAVNKAEVSQAESKTPQQVSEPSQQFPLESQHSVKSSAELPATDAVREYRFRQWLASRVADSQRFQVLDDALTRFADFVQKATGVSMFSMTEKNDLHVLCRMPEYNSELRKTFSARDQALMRTCCSFYTAFVYEEAKEVAKLSLEKHAANQKSQLNIANSLTPTSVDINNSNMNDASQQESCDYPGKKVAEHPTGVFFSWEILNESTAIKTCDKSFFDHNMSGVPKEICWFFDSDSIQRDNAKNLEITYNGTLYTGKVAYEAPEYSKVRISWDSALGEQFFPYKAQSSCKAIFQKIGSDSYCIEMAPSLEQSTNVQLEANPEMMSATADVPPCVPAISGDGYSDSEEKPEAKQNTIPSEQVSLGSPRMLAFYDYAKKHKTSLSTELIDECFEIVKIVNHLPNPVYEIKKLDQIRKLLHDVETNPKYLVQYFSKYKTCCTVMRFYHSFMRSYKPRSVFVTPESAQPAELGLPWLKSGIPEPVAAPMEQPVASKTVIEPVEVSAAPEIVAEYEEVPAVPEAEVEPAEVPAASEIVNELEETSAVSDVVAEPKKTATLPSKQVQGAISKTVEPLLSSEQIAVRKQLFLGWMAQQPRLADVAQVYLRNLDSCMRIYTSVHPDAVSFYQITAFTQLEKIHKELMNNTEVQRGDKMALLAAMAQYKLFTKAVEQGKVSVYSKPKRTASPEPKRSTPTAELDSVSRSFTQEPTVATGPRMQEEFSLEREEAQNTIPATNDSSDNENVEKISKTRVAFLSWLQETKNIPYATGRSYVKRLGEYLIQSNLLAEDFLLVEDTAELAKIFNKLKAGNTFTKLQAYKGMLAILKFYHEYRQLCQPKPVITHDVSTRSTAVSTANPPLKTEKAFRRWMADCYGARISHIYGEAIIAVAAYAQQLFGADGNLFACTTAAEVEEITGRIRKDEKFLQRDNRSNGRYLKSLKYYYDFVLEREIENAEADSKPIEKQETVQIPIEEVRPLENNIQTEAKQETAPPVDPRWQRILVEGFVDGYEVNDMLSQWQAAAKWEEFYGEACPLSDDAIDQAIAAFGVLKENRIYAANEETSRLIDEICAEVGSVLEQYSCVQIDQLYERYREKLFGISVYSSEAMAGDILKAVSGKYIKKYNYFQKPYRDAAAAEDCMQALRHFGMMSRSDLERELWFLPWNTVYLKLNSTPECIFVGDGTWMLAEHFPFTEEDAVRVSEVLDEVLISRSSLLAAGLMSEIENRCPDIASALSQWDSKAVFNLLRYYLSDRFSFTKSIVAPKGKSVDVKTMFIEFGMEYDSFSMDELDAFTKELGLIAPYWESIYMNAVRINETDFVSHASLNFDVDEIDRVLEDIVPNDYLSLQEVPQPMMMHFPRCGFVWNGYLLMCYVHSFSKKFRFIYSHFAKGGYYGAIVRRSARHILSYDDLLEQTLTDDDSWQTTQDALNLIASKEYQATKKVSNIGDLIKKAKLNKINE